MTHTFLQALDEHPLLCDGAMGTMIYAAGISPERCFDELNLTNPMIVADIHRAYIAAGANVIETNTFGANRFKLAEYGLADKAVAINHAGVELARRVVEASYKSLFIAGSIGPTGGRLVPLGRITRSEARQIFREQIEALLDAGVDVLMFETFADVVELREAISAVVDLGADVPVVAQISLNQDGRTPLGYTPQKAVDLLTDLPIDVLGVNCAVGPTDVLQNLKLLAAVLPEGMRLSAQPNAGWPENIGQRTMYPAPPRYFGDYALAFVEAGARLVGGCCGTTPEHAPSPRQPPSSRPIHRRNACR